MIDLRSDTVTRPSPAMREAMSKAKVGDDVFGEDPTINALQARVADLLGKEAALYVPSGVMANQLGMMVHTEAGDEVLVDRQSHIFNYESGAPSAVGSLQLNPLEGQNGLLDAQTVKSAIRPGHYWEPQTRLLCLENTVNKAGGIVYPLERMEKLTSVARENGLATHLDGARLFNASVASGVSADTYAALFDTVWIALSKGLGAPVGSVIAGTKTMVQEMRRYRKMLGGGMRQAGILAAAGLYALEHHIGDLQQDHDNAQTLAEAVDANDAFEIDLESVQSNIIMFDVNDAPAAQVVDDLKEQGIGVSQFGPQTIRITTHRDVSLNDIQKTASILTEYAHA